MNAKSGRPTKRSGNRGLAAQAYITVREHIVRGELAIGQVISRRKVAAELGMSFLPVTEALIRLENEGLLESKPRVGTRVRVPTRQDVEGHYVVREALEVQAARLFTERAERGERAELVKLAKRVDALSAQAEGDRFVYAALHEELHRRIAEFARCSALSHAIGRTSAIASTWLCATRASSRTNPRDHHENLMNVLVNDCPEAAADAMRAHIRLSMENALRRLELYFRIQNEDAQEYARTAKKLLSLDWLVPELAAPIDAALALRDLPESSGNIPKPTGDKSRLITLTPT